MIKRYIKILIILMISIIIIISPCISKAVEETEGGGSSGENLEVRLEKARQDFVANVIAFQKKHPGNACTYDTNGRQTTIKNGQFAPGVYKFDCVGWVNYAIHWYYKLSYNGSFYLSTTGIFDKRFDIVNINQAIPGDILIDPVNPNTDWFSPFAVHGVTLNNCDYGGQEPHVAVYIGNGQVVDMWTNSNGGGLGKRSVSSNWGENGWGGCRFSYAARLISLDGVHFGALPDGVDVTGGGSPEFQYSGMPLTVSVSGGYSLGYYVQKIGELYDYMIGIMFNAIKSIPIMIADGIQGIITDALNFLNGNGETSG